MLYWFQVSGPAPYDHGVQEGAWAEATDRGFTFYSNVSIDNGCSSSYSHFINLRRCLDGLVVLSITSQTAANLSTCSLDDQPRATGGLAYIPATLRQIFSSVADLPCHRRQVSSSIKVLCKANSPKDQQVLPP